MPPRLDRSPRTGKTPTDDTPIGTMNADGGAALARRDLVKRQILEKAAEIFADRGFHGTGIRDIAEALSMSRPAFYYYYSSKESLLEELVKDLTGDIVDLLREIRDSVTLSPREKLAAAVDGFVSRVAAKPTIMRLLAANERGLPANVASAHLQARREALGHLEAIIADGVRVGELRPVDERIAAFAIFGMCNWLAWWYRPDGAIDVRDIAQELMRISLDGLVRPELRRQANGIGHAVELLREDLEYLERLVSSTPSRSSA